MPLQKNTFSSKLQTFLKNTNLISNKKLVPLDQGIAEFCNQLETRTYESIRSADIVIPPNTITLTSPQGLTVTNAFPITLKNVIR